VKTPEQKAANSRAGARLHTDAENYRRALAGAWPADREFQAMIERDVATLHVVADLLVHGHVEGAARRFVRLDTAARDAASQAVIDVLFPETKAGGA
jgi:hypothetical protein